MQAILALEDGRIFRGTAMGTQVSARAKSFSILSTGYQESPRSSYAAKCRLINPQIQLRTPADNESATPYEGLMSVSSRPSAPIALRQVTDIIWSATPGVAESVPGPGSPPAHAGVMRG